MSLKAKEVLPNLYWVGVFDKYLQTFDIIMSTPFGTTYNAFILKTEKGNVLFETVKAGFQDELLERIEDVIGKDGTLSYVILNHTEPDHSGSISYVLKKYPTATLIGTTAGLNNIRYIGHIPPEVKTKDARRLKSLDLGNFHLQFLVQPFLHWPDTMFTVIQELKALVTCDVFGSHCNDERVFNDLIDDRIEDLEESYKHYFDTIFTPFKPHMLRGIELIETKMGFPKEELKAICCSHGPVLRTNIPTYIEKYKKWAQPTPLKDKVVICYGSAYGFTETMAKVIKSTIESCGVEVSLRSISNNSVEECLEDFEDAKGLLLGSPTIIGDCLPKVMTIVANLNPIVHCTRFISVFGSYGWSGEGITNIAARIDQIKCKQPVQPFKKRFKSAEDDLDECRQWATEFANALKA